MPVTGEEPREPLAEPGGEPEARPLEPVPFRHEELLAEPASSGARSWAWLPVALVVLALLCLGGTGYSVYRLLNGPAEARGGAPVRSPGVSLPVASGSAVPSASAPASAGPEGPMASDYPVREREDLGRVCEGWYYPQSPRFTGRAPHPILVSRKDRLDAPFRTELGLFDLPYDVKKSVRQAWEPENPAAVQLVACVDLVAAGRSAGECRFDEPAMRVPMVRGEYQVALYEVATGRRLLQEKVTGAGKCPFVALIGADKRLYTEVTDRQLRERLRRYVEG